MSNYNIVLVTRGLADDGGCVCRLVSMCACWMGVCVCVCVCRCTCSPVHRLRTQGEWWGRQRSLANTAGLQVYIETRLYSVYVRMCVCGYVCMCACVYVCMCVCVYVCMCFQALEQPGKVEATRDMCMEKLIVVKQ